MYIQENALRVGLYFRKRLKDMQEFLTVPSYTLNVHQYLETTWSVMYSKLILKKKKKKEVNFHFTNLITHSSTNPLHGQPQLEIYYVWVKRRLKNQREAKGGRKIRPVV